MSLARCHNVEDFRAVARRRLPAPLFDYIDGGADDEWSLRNNTSAFDRRQIMPRQLVDVSAVDLSTTVLGRRLSMPLMLSPTGMSRLFHHGKELAVARAADKAGVMYGLSTMATTRLEDVAAVSSGPRMFQVYVLKDRGLTLEFAQRARASGYDALCLTVDTALAGNRERDLRNGMVMPLKVTARNLIGLATRPGWTLNTLRDPDFRLANLTHRADALNGGAMGVIDYVNSQFDRSVTWENAAWLARAWGGPFVIKGLQHPEDARRAVDIGATAVMISNHGGRQLDGAPAPVDCVAPMREAVGDALQLIVDGGVRRGTHVLKALALGADACSIGRPYLYGLAAGGEAGVSRVLSLLRDELARSMALAGLRSVAEIDGRALFTSARGG